MCAAFLPGPIGLIILCVIVVFAVAGMVLLVNAFSRGRDTSRSDPNLRPCPGCAELVSLRATACPQCGCPLQN